MKIEIKASGITIPEMAELRKPELERLKIIRFVSEDETFEVVFNVVCRRPDLFLDALTLISTGVEERDKKVIHDEVLYTKISSLGLSARSISCLSKDLKYLGDIVQLTAGQLMKVKNFGRKSLREVELMVSEKGFKLGMKLDNFPDEEIISKIKEREEL